MGWEERALVQCMLLRAAYGGMPCDIAMLRDFAKLWSHRCCAVLLHMLMHCTVEAQLHLAGITTCQHRHRAGFCILETGIPWDTKELQSKHFSRCCALVEPLVGGAVHDCPI
jgi:hypothetical protein